MTRFPFALILAVVVTACATVETSTRSAPLDPVLLQGAEMGRAYLAAPERDAEDGL